MSDSSATVATIIPTRNRVDVLSDVIRAVQAQTIPSEIFVMDDASTDETATRIPKEFPQVRYFREEKNKGPTFQRNKAAAMTKARFLVTVDDDCLLASPKIFEQTLAAFDHPRVGAVTMPFINVRKGDSTVWHRAENPNSEPMAMYDYYGGMVTFRRDVFMGVGGYRSFLFMHVEEGDLATRIYNAGYVIRLGWSDPLHHLESPVRNTARLDVLGTRNHILYSYYNVPWPYYPFHLTGTVLLSLRAKEKQQGYFPRALRGVGRGMTGIFQELGQRRPVSRNAYLLVRRLRAAGQLPLSRIGDLLPAARDFSE
ncbi:MAG: glycosyltransferase family A protein [Tepidisphaeraceae bacterium]|jgi:glycosyltransferase involved in cell wall biosynthesis